MIYRFADIGIKPYGTLGDTANALGKALGGLEFSEDFNGTFDEFPAYIAHQGTLRFALLGLPPTDFDIREITTESFQLLVETIGPDQYEARDDISNELIQRISANCALICWKLK